MERLKDTLLFLLTSPVLALVALLYLLNGCRPLNSRTFDRPRGENPFANVPPELLPQPGDTVLDVATPSPPR